MMDLKGELINKRILVTGSSSMVGRPVVNTLKYYGAIVDEVLHSETDLLSPSETRNRFLHSNPNYVIHLAGWNGNIDFNRRFPATIYYRTTLMGLNVLQSCLDFGVKKVVSVISSCAYPDLKDEELKEDSFQRGPSNESVRCHGHSKRTLDDFSYQLYKQYGLKAVCCVLSNSYGPYDSFDENRTKVVSGLIKKYLNAKEKNLPYVSCWGTGKPLRQLIYSEDAANLITSALNFYNDPSLVLNIGCPYEVSIKELSQIVSEETGYLGATEWDITKQDGQYRKFLSLDRMNSILPKIQFTSVRDGVRKTIKWYLENRNIWVK